MSPDSKRILEEAMRLPPGERADLAGRLLESIEPGEDAGIEEAWSQEIARRVRELKAGRAKTIPWSEVKEQLRAIVDAHRPR